MNVFSLDCNGVDIRQMVMAAQALLALPGCGFKLTTN
jgi:hypothetical protein